MPLSDLMLLGIAFGAGCIYAQSSEELYCLVAGIIGSICLLLGLVLAPWPIQLGLLMLLFGFDKLKITKGFQ